MTRSTYRTSKSVGRRRAQAASISVLFEAVGISGGSCSHVGRKVGLLDSPPHAGWRVEPSTRIRRCAHAENAVAAMPLWKISRYSKIALASSMQVSIWRFGVRPHAARGLDDGGVSKQSPMNP